MEVAVKLSQIGQKVTKLSEELAQQSKTAKDTASTLQALMVSIENLGNNIKKRNEEMTFQRDKNVMEAEEELAALADPISLLEPAKSAIEVIHLLSPE